MKSPHVDALALHLIDNIRRNHERMVVLTKRPVTFLTPRMAVGVLLFLSFVPGLTVVSSQEAVAKTKEGKTKIESSDFVRFTEDDERGRLETSIVRYSHKEGNYVDLIGAVHIGDTPYYDALNKRMEGYDALLYEMVGDPEELKDVEKLASNQNPMRMMMRMVKTMLKLDYQLDAIDYTKPNFVHADLDMDEFKGLMADRGENIFTLIQNAMRKTTEESDSGTESALPLDLAPILAALASPDSASALKLFLAEQFDKAEALLDSVESESGTVILTERNKHVMKIISEQLTTGKKKLGVFYGAAHLVDLERRLLGAGYRKTRTEWLTAWDVPKPQTADEKETVTQPE